MKGKALKSMAISLVCAGSLMSAPNASAGSEPFLGEIMWVGFNYCPRGFADANGQLLPISQNSALFSLLGTIYGGDGRSTFALPDLRGRAAVHFGSGPGLSTVSMGQKAGVESVTLTTNNLPNHSHTATLNGTTGGANSGTVTGGLAADTGRENIYSNDTAAALSAMSNRAVTVGATGAGQSFSTRSPYLGMRACIATQGIFPSRN